VGNFSGRQKLVIVVVALLLMGIGSTAVVVLRGDDSQDEQGLSKNEAMGVRSDCLLEAADTQRYDETADYDDIYEDCLAERVALTPDELWAVIVPLSELPECNDIWVKGVDWTSELDADPNYGHECRYGSGEGNRYEAELNLCGAGTKDQGWLVVGPDDLYVWTGGTTGGSKSKVEDGSKYSDFAGEFVIDIARRVCAD
jgi:hypothetical protein